MFDNNTSELTLEKEELALIEAPSKPAEALNALLKSESGGMGELRHAWEYLQVYSAWGLRLSSSKEELKATLNIDDESTYKFFGSMLSAYKTIIKASRKFQIKTFPKVIQLGNSLRSFAEDSKSGDNGIWDEIIEMSKDKNSYKDNYEDLLELIGILQEQAINNHTEAALVSELLGEYKADLENAMGDLGRAKEEIEKDDKTSEAVIKKLRGGKNNLGSLDNLKDIAAMQDKSYKHNRIVAATSPTYAWVFPLGTIAAATVAGIYGKRAVDDLKRYKETMRKIEQASTELYTAEKAQTVYTEADSNISVALNNTNKALGQITIVQNAWGTFASNLKELMEKIEGTTKVSDDGEETLKGARFLKRFAKKCSKIWDKLWPTIVTLTTNPYITVKPGKTTIDEFLTELEAEVKKIS